MSIDMAHLLSVVKSDADNERNEWREKRCGNFTASTIWELMQEGKNGKRFSEAGEKQIKCKAIENVSGKPLPSGGRGAAAIQGIENEVAGLELLGLTQNKEFFKHKTLAFGATPDAIKVVGSEIWTYDIKHPYSGNTNYDYMTIKDFNDLYGISKAYFYQVIGQMLALDAECGYLIIRDTMTGNYNPIVVHRHSASGIIEKMTQRIIEAEKLRDVFVANYQANAKSADEVKLLI
jgi:hypothetical protein